MLRELLAGDASEIEESAMLLDRDTGSSREVDIVWRHKATDMTLIVSFEVVDKSRPADVQWVEQQILKHRGLPTDRLVLVSWSGFTDSARSKAAAHPVTLLLAVEQRKDDKGAALTRELRTLEVSFKPQRIRAGLQRNAENLEIECSMDLSVFDANSVLRGSVQQLCVQFLNSPKMREAITELRHRENVSENKYFELTLTFSETDDLYLQHHQTNELLRLLYLRVIGGFSGRISPLDMKLGLINEVGMGYAETTIHGRQALVVSKIEVDGQISNTTMRIKA